MLAEAAIAFCVTNAADQAVAGRVRGGSEAAAVLDTVAPGQTGCVSFPAALSAPMLRLTRAGGADETPCQTARLFKAGDTVAFTYKRAPSGLGFCYATEVTR